MNWLLQKRDVYTLLRRRKTLALGCCALTVAFGFVAGMAHVHEAGEHHDESRGLHLDHGHLGHANGHDHHHDAAPSHDHAPGVAQDHPHDDVGATNIRETPRGSPQGSRAPPV